MISDLHEEHSGTMVSGVVTCSCGFKTAHHVIAAEAAEEWDAHVRAAKGLADRACQANRFGHYRNRPETAEIHVLLTVANKTAYSMALCTEHAVVLVRDLPRRVRVLKHLTLELGWFAEVPL